MAASNAFAFVFASPTPMFSVIFETRGTCMIELRPSCSRKSALVSVSNWAFSRGK